eukprot:TRINITY_DN19227_c0_g1_i2.p1 TRINITY_DN19227_c0_g1~~TRINITY_DN19227_c0_g1_i2.p1  ORF type:complete len:499 (-),score=148.16 TRINITY_DN19227_c0_g1_i2:112-1524(-)
MAEEAAMAGLTAEQRAALSLFREVTANERDVQSSIQLMQSCDWDAERALHLHLASAEEAGAGGASSRPAAAAAPAAGGGGLAQGELGQPLLGGGGANQPGGGGRERSASTLESLEGIPIVGFLFRGLRAIGTTVFGVLRLVLFGGSGHAAVFGHATSGAAFRRELAASSGAGELPRFFEGTFRDALSTARQQAKLLVVYLHSDHARFAQAFCTQILCNDFVKSILDENFILWGGNISWMEAAQVSQLIHARQYPYLCALLPARGDELRVIGALEGNTEVDAAVALLTRCMEEMDSHRAEIVAHQAQQVEDRNLREQQDKEYQEALELDRKLEEERRTKAERRIEEERRREEELRLKAENELQETLARRQQKAQELPLEGPESTARISLRLPAGQRLQRKFRPDALLSEVYLWAECCAQLPENADRGLEVPARFSLKTSFPSKELTEMEKTVQELQLAGSNVLLAQIEDDD